ncbi:MAG: DUF370 domain-containing protein [Faecalibacterium sp.]
MYLHLGRDYVVNTEDIIGIFDLENTTVSKKTREFLSYAQQNAAVVPLSEDIPKSFIVADAPMDTIYLSSLMPAVLKRRAARFSEKEHTRF